MPSMTVSTEGSLVAGRWPCWRCARAIAAARRRIVETARPRFASEVDGLRGGGVVLRVVDQLGELGSQARGKLGRQPVERPVEHEHRLGVDGLDQIGFKHLETEL